MVQSHSALYMYCTAQRFSTVVTQHTGVNVMGLQVCCRSLGEGQKEAKKKFNKKSSKSMINIIAGNFLNGCITGSFS
jgi:hypothetical protein